MGHGPTYSVGAPIAAPRQQKGDEMKVYRWGVPLPPVDILLDEETKLFAQAVVEGWIFISLIEEHARAWARDFSRNGSWAHSALPRPLVEIELCPAPRVLFIQHPDALLLSVEELAASCRRAWEKSKYQNSQHRLFQCMVHPQDIVGYRVVEENVG